ncbi:Uncharacterised protein [Mycobacteroides abscessus subsp. abscessus]|nr:Uncharacterised protein [Mycobacteroides abscessus subsp. abscessus]
MLTGLCVLGIGAHALRNDNDRCERPGCYLGFSAVSFVAKLCEVGAKRYFLPEHRFARTRRTGVRARLVCTRIPLLL